jgi:hypothetical protein
MFKVIDVRAFGGVEAFKRQGGVYVGRPGPFGNRFIVGRHGDRAQCSKLYKQWLWRERRGQAKHVWAKLAALRGDELLGCWCHGSHDCHAHVLAAAWGYQEAGGTL